MSREFIDAIENGDNLSAESEFSDVMMNKVGNSLETNRQELANSFVNSKVNDVKETWWSLSNHSFWERWTQNITGI